jgi:hypothetical protein
MRRKKKTPRVQKMNWPVRLRCEICTPMTRNDGSALADVAPPPWGARSSSNSLRPEDHLRHDDTQKAAEAAPESAQGDKTTGAVAAAAPESA